MFKIVSPENREAHRVLIDAMHEMRYPVVVCEWGWDIPGVVAGYEADQFDTPETVYIIVRNDDGEVVASSRLNPSDRWRRAVSFRYCGDQLRYFDRPGAIPQIGVAHGLRGGDRLFSADYPVVWPKLWPGLKLANVYGEEISGNEAPCGA